VHPDFVQLFGSDFLKSENHVFEENWIENLQAQFSQMISGDGSVTRGILYDNVKNVTFRRNVIVNVSHNANIVMPGVRFENNTFYRMAAQLTDIGFSGSLTRGDGSNGLLKNNVFLAGGARASMPAGTSGFYTLIGAGLSKEVLAVFVTRETESFGRLTTTGPVTQAVFDALRTKGYIDLNGRLLAQARDLRDISEFVLDPPVDVYWEKAYAALTATVQLDKAIRGSFVADYNFVAGSADAGFPAKRTSDCVYSNAFTAWNFCELHGINGGNPQLQDLSSPLGSDGIPFTLDDGLKPNPGSPLCGKGEGGADIGAYSCDPRKVFSAGSATPRPPTDLRFIR
jgi:hypothetical protein